MGTQRERGGKKRERERDLERVKKRKWERERFGKREKVQESLLQLCIKCTSVHRQEQSLQVLDGLQHAFPNMTEVYGPRNAISFLRNFLEGEAMGCITCEPFWGG